MAYDIDSLKTGKNAPGGTQEQSDDTSVEAGVYRHPETGNEVITTYDPLYGNAQSEGFVHLGFVRVGDADPADIKTMIDSNTAAKLATEGGSDTDVRVQNLELKAELAELKAAKAAALAEQIVATEVVETTVVEPEVLKTKTEIKKEDKK